MLILVDSNYLCHRARHSMGELSKDGLRTEIIYNFMLQVKNIAKVLHFDPSEDKFCFFWDSKGSDRKTLFKEYKGNRKKELTQEELDESDLCYLQFNLIKLETLPMMGFRNIFSQEGKESDDLIAALTISEQSQEQLNVIVSSDHDLYQLLEGERVVMYDLRTKEFFKEFNLKWAYGIPGAPMWKEIKAIAGCDTDGVPGVPGVGVKTAAKYLTRQLKRGSKVFMNILNNEELIKRNRDLVYLPFPGTDTPKLQEDELSVKKFMAAFNKYGFITLLDDMDTWVKLFQLK